MDFMRKLTPLLIVGALFAAGCSDDPEGTADTPVGGSGLLTTVDNGDGTFSTTVDASATATSMADWVFMDLATGNEVAYVAGMEQQATWDLAFNRFTVMVNGGVSGAGGVGVAYLDGVDMMSVDEAPDAAYHGDMADADGDGAPEYAFGEWYSYDSVNHLLAPKDRVYFVKATDGSHYKLQFTDYYEPIARTSGFPQFTWAPVGPPNTSGILVDASSSAKWVYFSLTQNSAVSVSDPAVSKDWDLAFQRTAIQTNSGASGIGAAGARVASLPYGEIVETLPYGFEMDVVIPASGAPGSQDAPGNPVLSNWYDYDFTTHTVSPKAQSYLVRSAKGGYFKLNIESYQSGEFTIRTAPIQMYAPEEMGMIDASDATTWAYFSFQHGGFVSPADPANDLSWDLAISRTDMLTNSGVSGPGMGGALIGAYPEFENISQAPESGYMADEIIPASGAPGSQDAPGNPVLAEWYDYDFTTHTVSPKDETYVVRTADGMGYGKFKILSYDSGMYDIDWQYTGAGLTDFDTSGGRPEGVLP